MAFSPPRSGGVAVGPALRDGGAIRKTPGYGEPKSLKVVTWPLGTAKLNEPVLGSCRSVFLVPKRPT